ncbi:hypothetical protein A2962_04065 [Candidatus Woesebacteria bacterium RIFCSPLOWO2_01_FULL_39_61]|uniref:DNA replication and repair protein RecF n=1 Tax=Candidatus Woesebacteria bacterium RIFCSPHIGHO2_02_FULL_39_13 TaxID=1802505 RepID=A0A1F7YXY8_9BACT|nr:MAG: hypothetical protein A2692_02385 [Candidatus Woesebacteria bacterium RIFCSPHIGHO2_01_FULL_39_95]OGM32137.1 MAG: hypothetical protein A3D01_01995 [Candidatus Woesebacteria bacterium RIFCSPHIGHO2_02_FULL_39_13]OGM37244.1 MAG: hypothetical protein A3E13_03400 [Candidatus Woesebacteria bacterium RIFCSPHIGHO2_12_FULL_40_20]OGM65929.1 MAG: hypothetical protein A2962_04065 [Candidatus Woesebacteria bacterium RIFCSPLOWO2_01_FULL_39_61]OGM71431.1 MAG: hypothetical protein A3H19_04675 [Candidatus
MRINKIRLSNFRNFKAQILEFSEKIIVIVGPNASGKTNIIEAIFLLSTGKSFHARVEEEMVHYEEEIGRVKGSVVEADKERVGTNLEVILTRGEITVGVSPKKTERIARKKLVVNGVARRLVDFAGRFKVVLFGPWDMSIVTGPPTLRRNFLDTVLSQVDREYRRASLSYEKGLRQRNRLLFRIREEGLSRSQLLFWDQLLIKNGNYLTQRREDFIGFANKRPSLNNQVFNIEYDKSIISQTRLEQYKDEEVAAATTLVGPHRDDFIFKIQNPNSKFQKERELSRYGSRGEQRMGILWLKIAELSFIESESEDKPTLLLDDIFSELDHEHRKIVLDVSKNQQTIITTADPHYIEEFEKIEIIKLK